MKDQIKNLFIIITSLLVCGVVCIVMACVSSGPGPQTSAESTGEGDSSGISSDSDKPLLDKIVVPDKVSREKPAKESSSPETVVIGSTEEGGVNDNHSTYIDSGPSVNSVPFEPERDLEDNSRDTVTITRSEPVATDPPKPKATQPPKVQGNISLKPEGGVSVAKGKSFEAKININTGGADLASWGFTLVYDASVIGLDTSKGSKGIEKGAKTDGSTLVINANTPGEVKIAGFATDGLAASTQLNLYTLHWKTLRTGSTRLELKVDTMTNSKYVKIQTPNVVWIDVKVN